MTRHDVVAPYDVRVWTITTYRGTRGVTYTVRWRVGTARHQDTFPTRKLAESFRSKLLVAAKEGESFDEPTGLPIGMVRAARQATWYELACRFMDTKWAHAAPRHRKSIAEGLVTATLALVRNHDQPPDPEAARRALMSWSFNKVTRQHLDIGKAPPPDHLAQPLRWVETRSVAVQDLATPSTLRTALDAIALTLDGNAASPSTVRRKRSAIHALDYAVEQGLLEANPLRGIKVARATPSGLVDRRVVINPEQARALLAAVREHYPAIEAFFACLYFAGLRPAEARGLRVADCYLPPTGWGTLHLVGSTPVSAASWTDDGVAHEDRQLKHRAVRDSRPVPAPPELVETLHRHINAYSPGHDGRLFVTRTGRARAPLAAPYAKPLSMGIVYRVWDQARMTALSEREYASPLAKRPYDLRHAAVSLWLNAGVSPVQVAEWAGHSVQVLLRVYASCVYGREDEAKQRIEGALDPDSVGHRATTSARIPHGQP